MVVEENKTPNINVILANIIFTIRCTTLFHIYKTGDIQECNVFQCESIRNIT